MFGAPPKPAMRPSVTVELLPARSILQGRADEHIAGIEAGGLTDQAVRPQRSVMACEIHVVARRYVLLHSHLAAEGMDLLDPAAFDGRDQRRVRVQCPVGGDLSLEAEPLAVGRQQEFDGRRRKADAVVEPPHTVFAVDALDGHHGHQDLVLGDARRIAGEQRFDIEGLVRLDDEVDLVAGYVDAGHLVDELIHLGDHDARLEGGRLDDGGRVLGVGAGVEIAVAVGLHGGDQGDVRRQIHEVAGKQLDIGMDGPELDLAGCQRARDRGPLLPRIGEVELARDAALEQVEVGLENDSRLHDMEIVDSRPVDVCQDLGEEVGLFLVVALEADPVAGVDDHLEKRLRALRRHDLATGVAGTCI
jgi:hypothetical protein